MPPTNCRKSTTTAKTQYARYLFRFSVLFAFLIWTVNGAFRFDSVNCRILIDFVTIHGMLQLRKRTRGFVIFIYIFLSILWSTVSGLKCVIIVQTNKCSLNSGSKEVEKCFIWTNNRIDLDFSFFFFIVDDTTHLCLCKWSIADRDKSARGRDNDRVSHTVSQSASRPATNAVNRAFFSLLFLLFYKFFCFSLSSILDEETPSNQMKTTVNSHEGFR